jgi:predicted GNAT family N-acyltransferase
MEIEIRIVNTGKDLEQALKLRRQVFVEEQMVAPSLEHDAQDKNAIHFVAMRAGIVIGTARLLPYSKMAARVSRMAVHKKFRLQGIGKRLLEALEDEARKRLKLDIVLHAQTHAAGFYRACGYAAEGTQFVEANIMHIEMVKRL